MTEREFLMKCREFMEIYRKAHDLCLEIQSGLNDDYRNRRISYEEWTEKTQENDRKKALLKEQFDLFSQRLDSMKED